MGVVDALLSPCFLPSLVPDVSFSYLFGLVSAQETAWRKSRKTVGPESEVAKTFAQYVDNEHRLFSNYIFFRIFYCPTLCYLCAFRGNNPFGLLNWANL